MPRLLTQPQNNLLLCVWSVQSFTSGLVRPECCHAYEKLEAQGDCGLAGIVANSCHRTLPIHSGRMFFGLLAID